MLYVWIALHYQCKCNNKIANKIDCVIAYLSLPQTYMRLPKAWRGNDTKISMYSLSLVATQIQMMILSKHPNGALTYLLVITHYTLPAGAVRRATNWFAFWHEGDFRM